MAHLSFGSLLKNPLVLGVLATEMTSNLAKSYTEAENNSRAEEAQQTQELDTIAASRGEPITEMPRQGLFGKLASKAGLISPTTPVSPYQLASENLAIQGQQGAQRKEQREQKVVDIAQERADAEKLKAQQGGKQATIINYGAGPGGSDIIEPKVPGATGLFHAPPKPEKSLERISEEAVARTSGGITGKLNSDIASSPNPYYDPATGNPVKKSMTIADARKAGYIPASPKAIQSYQDAKAVTSELDRLDEIAQRRLPDTTGMSDAAKTVVLAKSWATLHAKTGFVNTDNEANDIVNASKLPAIQLIHDIQQRYPSQIELRTIEPLLPGPRDDRQSFHEKVMRLKSLLSHGVNQGAREDAGTIIHSEGESAATDWIGGSDE
jgi:hypothetical protein